jgi:hypothetical protein
LSEEYPVANATSDKGISESDAVETDAAVITDDEEVTPEPAPAKPAPGLDPKQAAKIREREIKAAQKAEAEARKADMKKFAAAEKEGDKLLKAAELAQAKADKATAAAEKAQAAAELANEAASTDATDQAKAKATKADTAAAVALTAAAEAQQQAKAANKAAAKVRNARRLTGHQKVETPGSRQWVPPTFITVGLLGVLWMVVFYVTSAASIVVPVMSDLSGWNVLIGMGLMAASFGIATLWK